MTQIKDFIKRNNHWITAVNTALIIVGIVLGIWQRANLKKNSEMQLDNQDTLKMNQQKRNAVIERADSIQAELVEKLDKINNN